ncbi:Uncharacterized protein dnm_028980 [Desulfonema magnum]|uniref:Uncharacterized protein n=1 Tax=Desulfonema magnum TaxID=45655 RepID=A0A975BK59_9BACT|nr:Uncharacterized protein dnm_028980 [Desulfonema magnum]
MVALGQAEKARHLSLHLSLSENALFFRHITQLIHAVSDMSQTWSV